MLHTTLRHIGRPLFALGFFLAAPPPAWAGGAGDAGLLEGGGGDAADAGSLDASEDTLAEGSPDSPPQAADVDAGVDAAEASAPPAGIFECPVEDVGNPCDHGGTCLPATCGDWGSSATRACAACEYAVVPYCATGATCGDGSVCQVMGGGAGSGIPLDGGSEFISYTNMGCGQPPVQSPPGFSGTPDGDGSTAAPPECGVVAPLGTAPGRSTSLAAALVVAIAARRRRHARPRRVV